MVETMKKSKYNYSFEYKNKYYIYNPYSGLCQLGEKAYEYYNESVKEWPIDLKEHLIERKYLIDDINEYTRFSIMRNRIIYNKNTLLMEIAPTLKCNCACGYCFVSKCGECMSEETEDAFIEFLGKRINQGVKTLKVTWFGGEPLMAYDVVKRLSCKIINLCDKNNVSYQAFLITNGILLTKQIVENFEKLRINGLQITLDGTEKFHNKERPCALTNGFKTILSNLQLFTGKIKPIIRINVSKRNCGDVVNLLSDLNEFHPCIKSITFSPVISINETDKSYGKDIFDGKEYSKWESKYIEYLNQYTKLRYEFHIKGKYVGDAAKIVNSFCMDPNGSLYKSGFMLGNKEWIITNIKNFNLINCFSYKNFTKYFEESIEKKCQDCFFLPYCVGGEASMTLGKCDSIRYNFDQLLKMYVDTLFENKE